MNRFFTSIPILWKELFFQLVLHLIVFTFYSFDKNEPTIESYQIVFFLNYVLAALVINYILLPRFYYQKKYFLFLTFSILIIVGVIVIEEAVLEQIYFPNTRGQHFPGLPSSGVIPRAR